MNEINNTKEKIVVGLDIGVASVGWSIVNEATFEILAHGVRLFKDAADAKTGNPGNMARRAQRHLRRRLKRKFNRKKAFVQLLVQNNLWTPKKTDFKNQLKDILSEFDQTFAIYGQHGLQIRNKAIDQKIELNQLIHILFWYLNNRGYFYDDLFGDEEDEDTKKKKGEGNILLNSLKELATDQNLFPSQYQALHFAKYNYYYGSDINSCFKNSEWQKEIKKVLEQQNLDQKFCEDYLFLQKRIRSFEKGPGSEISPTKYGLFYEEYDKEQQSFVIKKREGDNLWTALIGKCTYFPEEKRGKKNSPLAEIFTIVNELSDIRLQKDKEWRLEPKDLFQIIFNQVQKSLELSKIKDTTKVENINLKVIAKYLNARNQYEDELKEDDFVGYKTEKAKDSKNPDKTKALFRPLNSLIDFLFPFLKADFQILKQEDINFGDIDFLKEAALVFDWFGVSKTVEPIFEEIKKHQNTDFNYFTFQNLTDEQLKNLIELVLKKVGNKLFASHSLSNKAMLCYLTNALEKTENQMQFFFSISNTDTETQNLKYIPKNYFEDLVVSPSIQRSIRQTCNVINAIIKEYTRENKDYQISKIAIELARDKNSAEERKKIQELQLNNSKLKEQIKKEFNKKDGDLKGKIPLAYKCWKMQDHKDPYDLQIIEFEDVFNNYNNYQVDHILPWSKTGDNSFNNLVLTKKENNARKGNLYPVEYFKKIGFDIDKFKTYVENNKGFSKEKKRNLLFDGDYDDLLEFVGRSLSDTRTATISVFNKLSKFFNSYNVLNPSVTIVPIRGSVVSYLRKKVLKLKTSKTIEQKGDDDTIVKEEKDRTLNRHHAEDATICAYLSILSNSVLKKIRYANIYDSRKKYNKEKHEDTQQKLLEEITIGIENIKVNNQSLGNYIDNKEACFSLQQAKRTNIQYFDLTRSSLRKFKDDYMKINRLNLLAEKTSELDPFFNFATKKDEKEKLLCYLYSKPIYDKLCEIYKEYRNQESKTNPFVEYCHQLEELKNPNHDRKKFKPRNIPIELNNQQKVNILNLKYFSGKKNIDAIYMDNNSNKKAFFDGLNWIQIRIYKIIKKNKISYSVFPITIKYAKQDKITKALIPDEDKILNYFENLNYEKNYLIIENFQVLTFNNNLYYVCGCDKSQNKLEIKKLNENHNTRLIFAISSLILKGYQLCDLSVLGKIYNRRNFFND